MIDRAPASTLLARNVEAVAQLEAADRARQTVAERSSDAVAQMAGSTWFVGIHVVCFAAWIAWNTGHVPGWRSIDTRRRTRFRWCPAPPPSGSTASTSRSRARSSRSRASRPWRPFPFSFLTLVVSLEAIFLTLFVLISQNSLTRLSERRAHLDLQVNLLAEQESTRTVALLERIAQELNISLPANCDDAELAATTDIREVVSTLDRIVPSDSCGAISQT